MNTWMEALKHNSISEVDNLIEHDSCESALGYAIRSHCDFSLLLFLVENGADIYDFDNEGVSISDVAITYSNLEMVRYFLSKEADVNETKRRSGFTPLMCSACYGRYDKAETLLEKGADKEVTDLKGRNAIEFARKMNKTSILKLFAYDENAKKTQDTHEKLTKSSCRKILRQRIL